jgi:hypothetical protein
MLAGDPIAFIPRCPYRYRTGDWNTNKGVHSLLLRLFLPSRVSLWGLCVLHSLSFRISNIIVYFTARVPETGDSAEKEGRTFSSANFPLHSLNYRHAASVPVRKRNNRKQ